MSRIEREKQTVRKMIELYCRPQLPRRRSHVILQGKKEIINLVFHSLIRTFAPDGYTEFLHITSERGLRDGSLPAIGILHRRRAARICAAEVLRQLSFAE